MNDKALKIAKAVINTVDFKGGTNVTESVVVIMIVATVAFCTIKGIDIPPLIATAFGSVLGWLFKRNAEGDNNNE